MDKPKTTIGDVEVLLTRWREIAGANWREAFQHRLDAHRDSYAGSGNPLDVWNGILLAHALEIPIPDWAAVYLARCAAGIHDLEAEAIDGASIPPSKIARALGMVSKGRGTTFSKSGDFEWLYLGANVLRFIESDHNETDAIFLTATECNSTVATVRRAWKRLQAEWPDVGDTKTVSETG